MFRLFNLTSCIIISAVLFFTFLLYDFQQKQRPNIILLTVDSLHRDVINDFNTPSLLKAAEKGFKSFHHGAISGWTGTSIVSLLRDLTPSSTAVHTWQPILMDLSLPLKELAADGYKVEGIQSFMVMDLYKNLGLIINDPGCDLRFWLADKKISEQPFFLWYHYLSIHLPHSALPNIKKAIPTQYNSDQIPKKMVGAKRLGRHASHFLYPPEYTPFVENVQDESIRAFDEWFKQFWLFFNRSGLRENTILIITADHGGENGEQGKVGHASINHAGYIHMENVDIPFFIWVPESEPSSLLKRKNY